MKCGGRGGSQIKVGSAVCVRRREGTCLEIPRKSCRRSPPGLMEQRRWNPLRRLPRPSLMPWVPQPSPNTVRSPSYVLGFLLRPHRSDVHRQRFLPPASSSLRPSSFARLQSTTTIFPECGRLRNPPPWWWAGGLVPSSTNTELKKTRKPSPKTLSSNPPQARHNRAVHGERIINMDETCRKRVVLRLF
ncbi:hypothetical protein LX36DRAFT_159049 [Colletotrichum falcatum]|nr:hypothetical protein LX36DRAFT_159049 [Colletotrichum falcatum]